MDKISAIELSKEYLEKLCNSDFQINTAWLFGSYAKGNFNEDSDIDLAIVLMENTIKDFDTEVKLMNFRKGEETIIEPHAFTYDEFNSGSPLIDQILKHGVEIHFLKTKGITRF